MTVHRFVTRAACCLTAAMALQAHAQTPAQAPYPNKPISVTLGLQAGTGSDVALRILMEKLGAALGQPVVVQSLPGASGLLAAQAAARAAPDGYTLVALSSGTLSSLPHMSPGANFNPARDLVPIAGIVSFPSILSVNRNVPTKTIAEFLDHARKNPGKLTYGSGGNGSVQHIAWESLKSMAGIDVLHVPYKGMAQATTDLAGGQIDALIQGVVGAIPFIKTGQLRPLAWTGARRNALLPDVPTLAEAGVTGYDFQSWTGLYGPAGMPAAVASRIHAEIQKINKMPDVQQRYATLSMELMEQTPSQLEQVLKTESARDGALVRALGLRAE